MTINVQEEMNNSVNILLDPNKPLREYLCAFNILEEYIDNIDYANGNYYYPPLCLYILNLQYIYIRFSEAWRFPGNYTRFEITIWNCTQ